MAEYDFRSLSPHDFELLCRDLLQKVLRVGLESFSAGRDSGIDFRYRTDSANLIVQCKHYADSGFETLCRIVEQKERKKLDALKPTRYILATSVGLTPHRKDVLQKILAPYCLATEDIVGRDDINNLLTEYQDIERKHFKLWLTSTPVLERVLHAGIFSDSDTHLERIRLRLSRYVQNESLDRNYNPRVIEYMTQARHAGSVAPSLYRRQFVDSLDNPATVWDHAFRHQISEAARNLLLVLTTMPDESELENLEKAFWNFHSLRQKRFGFPTSAGDWIDALKELDGNFIKTAKIGKDIGTSRNVRRQSDEARCERASAAHSCWSAGPRNARRRTACQPLIRTIRPESKNRTPTIAVPARPLGRIDRNRCHEQSRMMIA